MNNLVVGQKLWYVPTEKRSGDPYEVEVTKVGRKWATVGPSWNTRRIDLTDLRVDDGAYSSPGQCWASKEAYENYAARQEAWLSLSQWIRNHSNPPKSLTLEQISNIQIEVEKSE